MLPIFKEGHQTTPVDSRMLLLESRLVEKINNGECCKALRSMYVCYVCMYVCMYNVACEKKTFDFAFESFFFYNDDCCIP